MYLLSALLRKAYKQASELAQNLIRGLTGGACCKKAGHCYTIRSTQLDSKISPLASISCLPYQAMATSGRSGGARREAMLSNACPRRSESSPTREQQLHLCVSLPNQLLPALPCASVGSMSALQFRTAGNKRDSKYRSEVKVSIEQTFHLLVNSESSLEACQAASRNLISGDTKQALASVAAA